MSRKNPLISIIIPHFERVELLRETLQSIRAQTYQDWEVWIVDDGSKTDVWNAVSNLSDGEKIVALQRKDGLKGPSSCRNLGAKNAHGHWLIFLDSDDLLAPWSLESRADQITPNAPDFLVFPVALFQQQIGDMDCLWNQLNNQTSDLHRFLTGDSVWQTASPLWQRDAFLSIGGFNERVFYGDDSDLHLRALLAGLTYAKFGNALPDVFIRRSDQMRITNSVSEQLIASRNTRLVEGSRHLRHTQAASDLQILWEGQYFVEAEFLLFNLPNPSSAVQNTIVTMRKSSKMSSIRLWIIQLYFYIALKCKNHAYFILRCARRFAMLMLPRSYFSLPTADSQRRMSKETMYQIQNRLEQHGALKIKPNADL